jgi:mannose PTS system EIIA component
MAGLLIIAHAPLASALGQVASHVYCECANRVAALDVPSESTPDDLLAKGKALLAQLGQDEVLILVDVLGATPANIAAVLAADSKARVLAGVNVPMLWRTLCYLDEPLDALAERALNGATQGIVQVSAAPE